MHWKLPGVLVQVPNWQMLGSTSHSLMSGRGQCVSVRTFGTWGLPQRQTSGLTYTLVILHLIARRADAPEGSIQVLTGSRGAGTRQTHTLVDICWNMGSVGKSGLFCLCVSSKICAALSFSD